MKATTWFAHKYWLCSEDLCRRCSLREADGKQTISSLAKWASRKQSEALVIDWFVYTVRSEAAPKGKCTWKRERFRQLRLHELYLYADLKRRETRQEHRRSFVPHWSSSAYNLDLSSDDDAISLTAQLFRNAIRNWHRNFLAVDSHEKESSSRTSFVPRSPLALLHSLGHRYPKVQTSRISNHDARLNRTVSNALFG